MELVCRRPFSSGRGRLPFLAQGNIAARADDRESDDASTLWSMPSSSSKHSAEGRVALQKLVLPAHRQRGLVDDWAQRAAGGDLGDAFHLGEFVPEELLERAERTQKDAQMVIRLAGHQIALNRKSVV